LRILEKIFGYRSIAIVGTVQLENRSSGHRGGGGMGGE